MGNKGMRTNAYNADLDSAQEGGRLSITGGLEFADNHYKQDGAKKTIRKGLHPSCRHDLSL